MGDGPEWGDLPGDALVVIAPSLSLQSFRAARATCVHWKMWLPWRLEVVDKRAMREVWSGRLEASNLVVPYIGDLDCQHVRLDLLAYRNASTPSVRVDLFFAFATFDRLVLHSAHVDVCDDSNHLLHRVYLHLSSSLHCIDVCICPLGSLISLLSKLRHAERRHVVAVLRRYF